MLSVDEARRKILDAAAAIRETESVPLHASAARILARDVVSPLDVPAHDNSAMDGYAVNTRDFANGKKDFAVSQRVAAGEVPTPLREGTMARIFTGADVPVNADAVVMQENCRDLGDNRLHIEVLPTTGDNIRQRGQDIYKGARILTQGQLLEAAQLGLLASIGQHQLSVFRRLRVSLFGTGNELVEPGENLKAGQIYNSNRPMLEHLLTSLGCHLRRSAIVNDSLQNTIDAFAASAEDCDLIISTGGVSVGEEDHVKAAVDTLGKLNLWKVRLKPGKPLAYGSVRSAVFLGLPGNPVSAFVTFLLFAAPLIRKLQGAKVTAPTGFLLPADFAINKAQSRPEFLRVRIEDQKVKKFPNQSSGVLTSVCWANALARVPEHTTIREGDPVEVFPFSGLLG